MKHYSTAELEQYRQGAVSVLRRIQCSAHLKNCPECRRRMEEVQEGNQLIEELKHSLEIYRNIAGMPLPERPDEPPKK